MTAQQKLARAAANRVRAEERWKQAIRDARAEGLSLREVAHHAGVSHVRVLQVLREQ